MGDRFDDAIKQAAFAALEPEVEVRITLDKLSDVYTAAKQLAGCFDGLGMLDMGKTSGDSIELTNGSGIVFRVENEKAKRAS